MGSAAGTRLAKAPLPVLCVDLDGTLIRGDLAWECILSCLKTSPLTLFLLPLWLLKGRAEAKRQLAFRFPVDPSRLAYNEELIKLLQEERAAGRKIVLATAADVRLAESVAQYVGVFDAVYGSRDGLNLKGAAKADLLSKEFAESGYEYAGDSKADLEVWKKARAAYVVGTSRAAERAATVTTVKATFVRPSASFITWVT